MIFIESDDGYKKTDLKEGDTVIFFTDVRQIAFWRGDKYLFWSPLLELPSPLCSVMDIKLFYNDFKGGLEEFQEKASSFAAKRGFDLKRKEVLFGKNALGRDIPYIAFEFISKEVIENGNIGGYYSA